LTVTADGSNRLATPRDPASTPMNLAFDIDDTITAMPGLFAALSMAPGTDTVIIVSSRANNPESMRASRAELHDHGIRFDQIHLIDDAAAARERCPHNELDWYQKYLWQKVEICLREKIDVVFEDDSKVIELFKRYAPGILVLQVHRAPALADRCPELVNHTANRKGWILIAVALFLLLGGCAAPPDPNSPLFNPKYFEDRAVVPYSSM